MYVFSKFVSGLIYLCTYTFVEYKKSPPTFVNASEIKNISLYNQLVNIIHPVYIQLLKNVAIVNGNQKPIINKNSHF
jgi:hypothetical protein